MCNPWMKGFIAIGTAEHVQPTELDLLKQAPQTMYNPWMTGFIAFLVGMANGDASTRL